MCNKKKKKKEKIELSVGWSPEAKYLVGKEKNNISSSKPNSCFLDNTLHKQHSGVFQGKTGI